jgi:hypothetical protein
LTVAVTVALVEEPNKCVLEYHAVTNTTTNTLGSGRRSGLLETIRNSFELCSPTTRRTMDVQFFSWMAWFPFLFYVTS